MGVTGYHPYPLSGRYAGKIHTGRLGIVRMKELVAEC